MTREEALALERASQGTPEKRASGLGSVLLNQIKLNNVGGDLNGQSGEVGFGNDKMGISAQLSHAKNQPVQTKDVNGYFKPTKDSTIAFRYTPKGFGSNGQQFVGAKFIKRF